MGENLNGYCFLDSAKVAGDPFKNVYKSQASQCSVTEKDCEETKGHL